MIIQRDERLNLEGIGLGLLGLLRHLGLGRCVVNVAVRILGVWVLAGAALLAADFWDETDFSAWSDKDAQKMLTDSPWAKRVRVPIGGPGSGDGFSAFGGVGGGGNGGRGRGGGFDEGPSRVVLTVTWRSALPIKQAVVRNRIGRDALVRQVDQDFLDEPELSYVVSVTGLPEEFAQLSGRTAALMAAASLKLDRPDPIAPERAEVFTEEDSVTALWFFPRSAAITLDDKDVEFIANLGPIQFKRKFKLEDMLFHGELVL